MGTTLNASATGPPSQLVDLGRQAWSVLGVFLVIIGAAWLLPRVLLLVVPVTTAALITALLQPAASWIERRGLPHLASTWAVLVLTVAAMAGVVLALTPLVTSELDALGTALSGGLTNIEGWLVSGPFKIQQATVDSWSTNLKDQLTSPSSLLSHGALSQTPVALHVLIGSIVTAVLVFFFLNDGPRVAARHGTAGQGPVTAARLESAWSALGGYARGLVVNGVINAVVLGVALFVLGVPLALPLATITFVASFIPVAGAIFAGTLAALVALVASGPLTAALVIGVTIIIHHLEGYIVGPLVIGRRTGLHPVVLILGLIAGSIVAGIPGAFLAGPFAAATAGWRTVRVDDDTSRRLGPPEPE